MFVRCTWSHCSKSPKAFLFWSGRPCSCARSHPSQMRSCSNILRIFQAEESAVFPIASAIIRCSLYFAQISHPNVCVIPSHGVNSHASFGSHGARWKRSRIASWHGFQSMSSKLIGAGSLPVSALSLIARIYTGSSFSDGGS